MGQYSTHSQPRLNIEDAMDISLPSSAPGHSSIDYNSTHHISDIFFEYGLPAGNSFFFFF